MDVDPRRLPDYGDLASSNVRAGDLTLANLFASSERPFIEWESEKVYAAYELALVPGRLLIKFEGAKGATQGVRLKARGVQLTVNGTTSGDFILWYETSPNVLQVDITASKTVGSLKLWNVWRGGLDVTQAWLGNAGMRVRHLNDDSISVSCSDGHGGVTFDDLQFIVVSAHAETKQR